MAVKYGRRRAVVRVVPRPTEGAVHTDVPMVQLASGAVEHDLVAFPWAVGAERVVHRDAVAVADLDLHRVLDRDLTREDAPVPEVAVGPFRIQIKGLQLGIVIEVEAIGAGRAFRATVTSLPVPAQAERLGSAFDIEATRTKRRDRLRARRDPPIDEIEVMGRLVNEQATRLVLAAMPAAEVVGSVHPVEVPPAIHGGRLADAAGHKDLLQPA